MSAKLHPMLDAATVAIRGRHLTRSFGEGEMKTTALDDVTIDIAAGNTATTNIDRPNRAPTQTACSTATFRQSCEKQWGPL